VTAPGGVIATVYVDVLPTVRDFSRQLRQQLQRQGRQLRQLDRELAPVSNAIQQIGRVATGIVPGIQLTRTSLLALGSHAVVGGLLSAAGAAYTLSGALFALPAVGVAATSGMGALTVGLGGVEESLKGFRKELIGTTDTAFEKLSDNARSTIGVLVEFQGQIEDFRHAVQDRLFAGLDDVARGLLDTFLPRLQTHFGNLVDVINLGVRDLAAFAQTAETLADVDEVTSNTELAFSALRQSLIPAATALRDLVTVGSRFLPVIAAEVNTIVIRFSNWVQVMRATGELQDRIAAGFEVLRQLGRIFENVGRAVHAVLSTADDAGLGLLDTVERLTERLADFFESARGQDAIIQFLESARAAAETLTPVIVALADLFFNHLFPVLESFAHTVGPAVAEFFSALGDAIDQAAPGIQSFAQGFAAFIRGIIPALPAVAQLVGSIGQLVGVLAGRLGPIIADIITSIANILVPILDVLSVAFLFVNDSALRFVVVVATVVVGLGLLVTVIRGVETVIRIFAGGLELLTGGLQRTQGAVGGIVGFLSGPWGVAIGLAVTALGLFLSTSDGAAQEQTELKNAAQDLNDVIREQNGVINENVRLKAAQQLDEQGALDLARELGIAERDVTDAYLQQGDALDRVRGQLQSNIDALEAEQRKFEQTRGGRARAQEIQVEIDKNQQLLDKINQLVGERDADAAAQGRQRAAAGQTVGLFDVVTTSLGNLANAYTQANDALLKFQQTQLEQLNSEIAYFNQLERTRAELAEGTKTLDIHNQEGRDNLSTLSQLAAAGIERIQDLKNQGASTAEVAQATVDLQNQLLDLVQPFFNNRDAARQFLEQLGLFPTSVTLSFYTNLPQILADINRVSAAIGNIAGGIFGFGRRAHGGPVRPGEWTLVGEEGPELVRWGRAARVFSNDESERMATDVGTLDGMTARGPSTTGAAYGGTGTGNRTVTIDNQVNLQPTVRVYLGDRELTDVVRVEVDRRDRQLQRLITSNAGVRR
jgi:hypothetical protein